MLVYEWTKTNKKELTVFLGDAKKFSNGTSDMGMDIF